MIGEATHHSLELSWENEEYEARQGPPEGWTSFSIEKMDPKSRTYGTVYMWVSMSFLLFHADTFQIILCKLFCLCTLDTRVK